MNRGEQWLLRVLFLNNGERTQGRSRESSIQMVSYNESMFEAEVSSHRRMVFVHVTPCYHEKSCALGPRSSIDPEVLLKHTLNLLNRRKLDVIGILVSWKCSYCITLCNCCDNKLEEDKYSSNFYLLAKLTILEFTEHNTIFFL